IYVQQMSKLQVEHSNVYQRFEEGNHVVRISDRLWSGISVNLPRGRGMTEQQLVTWLLAMPACADVKNNTSELNSGVKTLALKETPSAQIQACEVVSRLAGVHAQLSVNKKNKATTFNTQSSVMIVGEAVQVDAQFLFQRLKVTEKKSRDLASVFKNELCSHPPTLLDT
ncbi:hypothetical protein MAR_020822, partial [Mya arenaria]